MSYIKDFLKGLGIFLLFVIASYDIGWWIAVYKANTIIKYGYTYEHATIGHNGGDCIIETGDINVTHKITIDYITFMYLANEYKYYKVARLWLDSSPWYNDVYNFNNSKSFEYDEWTVFRIRLFEKDK
jgi:hypothetical protein